MNRLFLCCRSYCSQRKMPGLAHKHAMEKQTSYLEETHNPKEIKNNLIGPADPLSNLRPVIYRIPENESELEKKLRLLCEEVQAWNQHFWLQHNGNFISEKQGFMKNLDPSSKIEAPEKKALTSEEMSSFYKDFLDKNWDIHLNYNKEWYKKNFKLLFLTYAVKCDNLKRKMFQHLMQK